MVSEYVPAGVPLLPLRLVVVTVMVEFAVPLPGVTEAGENVQLAAAGRPEQLRATDEGNVPPKADTVAVYLAELPALTVTLDGEADTE